MKLSIFKDVNPLPKSKEEKHQQSKKASQCETVSFSNDQQLFDFVTKFAWSPFIFHNNKRLASNFLSCDLLTFDVDDSMSIEEADKIIEANKLCGLILPSTSHTPENHRFRIILPLARTITSESVYVETWRKGAELFGVVDEQTKDLGRFYFACRDDDGYWNEGDFFSPVQPIQAPPSSYTTSQSMIQVTEDIDRLITDIYGEKRDKIPEAVDHFVKNAPTGLKGTWINDISRFTFSLTLSGVDDNIIYSVCEQLAPSGTLDKNDLYQIKRAIRDGKAAV